MRRIINIGVIAVMLLCSFSLCFATEETTFSGEEISPRYAAVNEVKPSITIAGGNASYYVKVKPMTSTSISYINITLKLVNSSGTVLKTKTEKVYFSNGYFKLSDSKNVSKGTYHAEYTLKVYKSGSLVETISGKSLSEKY